MASQSLVNRLLTGSLFVASCFGTLALFGAVPMLPQLTARLSGILPDLSELASESLQRQVSYQSHGFWIAQLPVNASGNAQSVQSNHVQSNNVQSNIDRLPKAIRERSTEWQRYRLPR